MNLNPFRLLCKFGVHHKKTFMSVDMAAPTIASFVDTCSWCKHIWILGTNSNIPLPITPIPIRDWKKDYNQEQLTQEKLQKFRDELFDRKPKEEN